MSRETQAYQLPPVPIAYQVDAILNLSQFIEPTKESNVLRERYDSLEVANIRKQILKDKGYIASVTPIFIKRTKNIIKQLQSAPFGDYRKEWTWCK